VAGSCDADGFLHPLIRYRATAAENSQRFNVLTGYLPVHNRFTLAPSRGSPSAAISPLARPFWAQVDDPFT